MLLSGILPTMAQFDAAANGFDPDSRLILRETQLSSPASDSSEGQHIEFLIDDNVTTFWHSDWHGTYSGDHYIQIDLENETSGYYQIVFGRRHNSNTCQPTRLLVEESLDGDIWSTSKTVEIPYYGDADQGTYVISDMFRLKGCNHIRVTCTQTNTNTKTWHCAELQIYPADKALALASAITELLNQYDKYLPGFPEELNIGTGFGQYSDEEAWADFQADLDLAYQYAERMDAGEEIAEELIYAIIEKTDADFERIMASLVTFRMDDGYYRIVGNLRYYNEVDNGEMDLDGNPILEKEYYDIAMYGSLDGWLWWDAKNDNDTRYLWKLSMEGKDVRMVNAATEMQCDLPQGEWIIKMSEDADRLMGFDYAGTENGHDVIAIRFANYPTDLNGGTYIHQMGHQRGEGKGPQKLGTWKSTWNMGDEYTSDKGTSEWYLERVSDEEAQTLMDAFELVKNHDKLVLNYQDYIAKAKDALNVAYDELNVWTPDKEAPVIQSTSQFHSLWTEPNEGSLDNLLDGDNTTFWHSRWSGGNATGPHQASLDVTLDEPLQGTYQLYVLRRKTDDDHITKTSLYGTNDDTALEDTQDTNWELIDDNISLPWYNGQYDVISRVITFTKPYKHLRFYEESAQGKNNGYRNFGHYATFQLYPTAKTKNSQFEAMGETGTTLEAIVNAYETLDLKTLTVDDYNALVDAYEAFKAVLVDPTELRNTIASNKKYPDYVIVGENPGYWTSDETAATLDKLLAAATEYDDSGKYTRDESDGFVKDILAAKEAIFSSAIGVDTAKWYHFCFDSEENFDLNNWSKNTIANGTLYNQRIAPGTRTDDIGTVLNSEDIKPGAELYYFSEEEMTNEEASQFRFVALTDSTYAIQNRASGMYIYRKPLTTNGGISLQWTPAAFTVKPIGYGQNILYMTLIDGQTISYPHLNAWESKCSYVGTWDDSHPGCNSHFLIEPVEDVDFEAYVPTMTLNRLTGGITPICYPMNLTVDHSDVYTPLGSFEQEGTAYLALKNKEGEAIEAGEPFFIIPQGTYDGEACEDVALYTGSSMTSQPKNVGGLVGTFLDTWIGTGYVYFEGNETKSVEGLDTGRNYSVPANSAYLKYGDVMLEDGAEYDLAIEINGKYDDWTGIQNALRTVSAEGAVYTISGKLVSSKATLKDVRSMGKGIYIMNGTKVIVK